MQRVRVLLTLALGVLAGGMALTSAHAGEGPGKYALILGGGNDNDLSADGIIASAAPTTIFDDEVETLGEKLKAAGYREATVYFDGQHAGSNAMIARTYRGYGGKAGNFTTQNADDALDRLIEKIQTGQISAGSEVLVSLDTHGSQSDGKGYHPTGTSSGPPFDPKQKLEALRDAAQKKGVRLAFLDMSCFSGNSLALAQPDGEMPAACVITGAPADQFSYPKFNKLLFQNLTPGRSLEDAFLSARAVEPVGFSQISTPAGAEAMAALKLISSQVLYDSDDVDVDPNRCTLDESMSSLRAQASQLGQLLIQLYGVDPQKARSLGRTMQEYLALKKQISDDDTYLDQHRVRIGKRGLSVKFRLLIDLDATTQQAELLLHLFNLSKEDKTEVQETLSLLPQMESERDRLLRQNARFRQIAQHKKLIDDASLRSLNRDPSTTDSSEGKGDESEDGSDPNLNTDSDADGPKTRLCPRLRRIDRDF